MNSKQKQYPKQAKTEQNRRGEKNNLINSRADELAAKNNMTKQNREIPTRFRVLGLLIQDEPSNGHQVRPLSICRMIHGNRKNKKKEYG